jgi:hypothetical protein
VQQTWIVIEKLNCKKQVWEKEENMMPVGKGGRLHVYPDQVVRAIHDVSILPQQKAQI